MKGLVMRYDSEVFSKLILFIEVEGSVMRSNG